MQEQFLYELEEILMTDNGTIQMGDTFRDYLRWDSLAVLEFVEMVDTNYGITIPREEFDRCQTVQDLYTYIMEKTGQ